MRTVQAIQIVVGSLGSVTKNLDKWLENLDTTIKYFTTPKNYATKHSKDFIKSRVSEF